MKKNTYILVGVLAILLVIAVILMNRPGEKNLSADNSHYLFNVDSSAIDKITLYSPQSKVTLEKKDGEWFLTEPIAYRADQSAVALVLHQSRELDVEEVVSSNPEKRSIFQVDSTGTAVRLLQGGEERAAFVVGKTGQSYAETYVRASRSNDVDLVKGSLSWSFGKSVKDWRDKTIFTVPKETIRQISYQYPDEKFSAVLQDSVWMIGTDKAKVADLSTLLGSLSNVQADDFVDSTIIPAPKISATISIGATQLRLSEIKGKDSYLVQTSLSPQWFVVQGWRAKQILKHKKDLI